MNKVEYTPNTDGRKYWCNAHNRWATYICKVNYYPYQEHCCDLHLSGILLPCNAAGVVDVTDILEIYND